MKLLELEGEQVGGLQQQHVAEQADGAIAAMTLVSLHESKLDER